MNINDTPFGPSTDRLRAVPGTEISGGIVEDYIHKFETMKLRNAELSEENEKLKDCLHHNGLYHYGTEHYKWRIKCLEERNATIVEAMNSQMYELWRVEKIADTLQDQLYEKNGIV